MAVTLYFLARTNKNYHGISHWSLGCMAIAVGFILLFMLQDPAFKILRLIGPNFIYLPGMLLLYTGTLRFFEKKENKWALAIFVLLYSVFTIYFALINNNLAIRRVVDSASFAIILLSITRISAFNQNPSIKKTLIFINLIIYFSFAFFSFRAFYYVFLASIDKTALSSIMQTLTFLNTLITGLAWGFSLIVMIYQRLFSEMKEVNERFELIFQTIPDPIIITEIDSGKIVSTNPKFTELVGYSLEELNSKSNLDIDLWKHPENRKMVLKEIREFKLIENNEFSFYTKEREELIGLYSARIIQLNGKPHLLSVIKDITSRKHFEKEIEQKNKELEKSNLEKDKFFSIIAHDLKSPFNSLVGLTEILAEDSEIRDLDVMRKMMKQINSMAKNVYALVENLLEWSLVKRGRVDFQPMDLRAEEAIQEAVSELSDMARKKSVDIEFHVLPDLILRADKKMLQTMLRNLISNAIKFTKRNGKVTVTAQEMGQREIEFLVSDNGIGMEPSMVEQLFQLDANVGRPGTEGEPTNGLGLVLCKEFVDKHLGQIWAESESNKGSIFHFTIPANLP